MPKFLAVFRLMGIVAALLPVAAVKDQTGKLSLIKRQGVILSLIHI